MKKNIKMNKNEMEANEFRAVIPYEGERIIIKNPDEELKKELLTKIATWVEKDEDIDEKEIINILVDRLVNVEFEVPITDIKNPSHHTSLILYYVSEIISELAEEITLASKLYITNKQTEEVSKKTEIKKEVVVKEEKEEVKEEKIKEEVPHRTVKKPQRGRKVRR